MLICVCEGHTGLALWEAASLGLRWRVLVPMGVRRHLTSTPTRIPKPRQAAAPTPPTLSQPPLPLSFAPPPFSSPSSVPVPPYPFTPTGASRSNFFPHGGKGGINVLEASMDQLNMTLPPWAIRAGARREIYFDPSQVRSVEGGREGGRTGEGGPGRAREGQGQLECLVARCTWCRNPLSISHATPTLCPVTAAPAADHRRHRHVRRPVPRPQ